LLLFRPFSVEFRICAAAGNFQTRGDNIIRHVPQMRLKFDRVQNFVVTQRLQIARIFGEESFQLFRLQNFRFDLLESSFANRRRRHRSQSVHRSVSKSFQFVEIQLIRFQHRNAPRLIAQRFVNFFEQFYFFAGGKRKRSPFVPSASSSSNSVDVRINGRWKIEIDHIRHLMKIDPS